MVQGLNEQFKFMHHSSAGEPETVAISDYTKSLHAGAVDRLRLILNRNSLLLAIYGVLTHFSESLGTESD